MTYAFQFNIPPVEPPSILPKGVTLHGAIKIVQLDPTRYEVLDLAVAPGRRPRSLGIFCKTQAVRMAMSCSAARLAR